MSSSTHVDGVCSKCYQAVIDINQYIKCTSCENCFHIECCDINDRSKNILNYNCDDCVSAPNDLATNVALLTNELNDKKKVKSLMWTLGMRHVQVVMLFTSVMTMYFCRLTISVAVVAMTSAATTNPDFPEFDWTEQQISYVLSSLFWGYICTQFPGGLLSKRFGTKCVMGTSMSILTVLTLVTPWSVGWGGWQIFCAIRVIQGMAQGVIYPCVFDHLAKWSPYKERNRLGGVTLIGVDLGTVMAMSISGAIAEGPMGWPGISYVSGGICGIWCLAWFIFGANTPHESRFISEKEKYYIETSLAEDEGIETKKTAVPWKELLKSIPFYAFIIARCSVIYGLVTFQTQIPSYLYGVLGMKIKANGLMSAMPFLTSFLMSFLYVVIADFLQRKEILSLTAVRRIFNSVATFAPALCIVVMGFLGEQHKTLALILLTVAVTACSCDIIGSALNAIDLSPNHAGVLTSIAMTTGALSSLVAPLVVGAVVNDARNRFQWQIVFAIAALIYIVGNSLYCILGSSETQPWNSEEYLLAKKNPVSNINNQTTNGSVKHRNVKISEEI